MTRKGIDKKVGRDEAATRMLRDPSKWGEMTHAQVSAWIDLEAAGRDHMRPADYHSMMVKRGFSERQITAHIKREVREMEMEKEDKQYEYNRKR